MTPELTAKTIAALSDSMLCAMAGDLGQTYVENEPSGELLGICLVEQARRFAARVAKERKEIL